MSIKTDYILNQIEKLAEFIGQLAFKKTEVKQDLVDQSLAELTGLNKSMFLDPKNSHILGSLLRLLSDDNQKALAARLLDFKGPDYRKISSELMSQIDKEKLNPQIKVLLGP